MEKKLICDLDRTILTSWDEGYAPRPAPWLDRILSLGKVIAIATNQGGISWRLAGGRPGKEYPSWPEVEARILAGMRWAGTRLALVALHHPGAVLPQWDDPALWERAREAKIPWCLLGPLGDDLSRDVRLSYREGLVLISWHPEWRKPNPKMLQIALRLAGCPHDQAAFIGDEDSDRQAAEAAGLEFIDVASFRNDLKEMLR